MIIYIIFTYKFFFAFVKQHTVNRLIGLLRILDFIIKYRYSNFKSLMAYFPYSGFANKGRLRLQENASTRSVKADVTEGLLRNVEVIGAAERAT